MSHLGSYIGGYIMLSKVYTYILLCNAIMRVDTQVYECICQKNL